MPSLSSVMDNAESTWAAQVDKGSLRGVPFWIHRAKVSDYRDENAVNPDGSRGRDVSVIVLDVTLRGPSRRDPRAVVIMGNTDERAGLIQYFADQNETGQLAEPIGPVHTFEVPLKRGGQTFWRLEDWNEDITGSLDAPAVTRGNAKSSEGK